MYDLAIIGSGPAGWTAAIYGIRSGLKTAIITGLEGIGGSLATTTLVENYPGFPTGIDGPNLMNAMEEQATNLGVKVIYEQVTQLELTGDTKTITTDEDSYTAKAVILSMGAEHKHLGIDGEDIYTNHGISTCATCDGSFFHDQPVVVIGGGDSACEEALYLSSIASHVTMLVRRDTLRASHAMAQRVLDNDNITVSWNTTPVGFVGVVDQHGHDRLTGVATNNGVTACDGAFVAIGHTPRSALVVEQVTTDTEGYVVTAPSPTTGLPRNTQCWNLDGQPLPGVFAAGDLVDRTYRQAITAAGSGCQAALDAKRWLEETA